MLLFQPTVTKHFNISGINSPETTSSNYCISLLSAMSQSMADQTGLIGVGICPDQDQGSPRLLMFALLHPMRMRQFHRTDPRICRIFPAHLFAEAPSDGKRWPNAGGTLASVADAGQRSPSVWSSVLHRAVPLIIWAATQTMLVEVLREGRSQLTTDSQDGWLLTDWKPPYTLTLSTDTRPLEF